MPSVQKLVKQTLKLLKQMLQDFTGVFDQFVDNGFIGITQRTRAFISDFVHKRLSTPKSSEEFVFTSPLVLLFLRYITNAYSDPCQTSKI